MQLTVNFNQIRELADFYALLDQKLNLPLYFGNNLEALYNSISCQLALPLTIEFENPSPQQTEEYLRFINTMKAFTIEVDGFSFYIPAE